MGEIQSRFLRPSANALFEIGSKGFGAASDASLASAHDRHERLKFTDSLALLVSHKTSWAPNLIAGELYRFLIDLGTYSEIIKLLKLRPYLEIVKSRPGLAFKYLVPNYLARGLSRTEGRSCFLHHYTQLHAWLPESTLARILQGHVTLHEIDQGGSRFAFTMGLPEQLDDKEGELALDLRVDNQKVCGLSFTIVPGWVVNALTKDVILISHLQGTRGSNTQIKLARQVLCDYSPRAMLLAALQGVASAFGISRIDAVCATRQRSYLEAYSTVFRSGYDDFFAKLGMIKTTAGFYSASIPIAGKPITDFRGRLRLRATKRRAMRQKIQAACAASIIRATAQTADSLTAM